MLAAAVGGNQCQKELLLWFVMKTGSKAVDVTVERVGLDRRLVVDPKVPTSFKRLMIDEGETGGWTVSQLKRRQFLNGGDGLGCCTQPIILVPAYSSTQAAL